MSSHESGRRRLLRALLALPVGYAASCTSTREYRSPEESLTTLILLLGPWQDPPGRDGERFAERFLAAPHLAGQFLPGASDVVQRVASRFDTPVAPSNEVDLVPLASDERELLLKLAAQLYSLNEIQCLAAGQPPFGECQDDGTWHTRAPG